MNENMHWNIPSLLKIDTSGTRTEGFASISVHLRGHLAKIGYIITKYQALHER